MNSLQLLQNAECMSKYSATMLVQPSSCLKQGMGDFKDTFAELDDDAIAEGRLDAITFSCLCFDPLCMLTPFLDVDSCSQ